MKPGDKVICINALIDADKKEEISRDFEIWVTKDKEYTIREILDNNGIVTGVLLEEICDLEKKAAELKAQLSETEKHLPWKELEQEERFTKPPAARKRLLDTVKMIAYRAETALCSLLAEQEKIKSAAARRLLQDLFVAEADIVPDKDGKRLIIQVHRSARPAAE